MSYGLICCHCHSRVRIRTSYGRHLLLREAYLQCTNEACGATFRAQFEVTHILSPSGMPNPAIDLPLAPSFMRRKAMVAMTGNEDQPDLLNDIEEEEILNATGAA